MEHGNIWQWEDHLVSGRASPESKVEGPDSLERRDPFREVGFRGWELS